MAKDLNKVMLIGYLGADPELRNTPQGAVVTTFRVACGRAWQSADGASHEETEWFRIVAWDGLGKICNHELTKGARVYIEGRRGTRSWQDAQTGQDRYRTEVIASDLMMLSQPRERERANTHVEHEAEAASEA